MKRILVLGASPAAVKAIESIKEKNADFGFTIISYDGFYPANRQFFPQVIAKECKTDELYYRKKDYYAKNNIQIMLDKKVSRVNFNRKKVFTEDKEQIDYDILLICHFPADQWPDIKGVNKTNIYGLNRLTNIHEMCEALPIAESIVIQSRRWEGLAVALAFAKQKKHVTLVTSDEGLLPQWLTPLVSAALINKFAEQGLTVITNSEIAELLGEGEAKAVRLKSNKVLASDFTIFADAPGDPKIFADSSLALEKGIIVDENFKTNIENVYALDLACQQGAQYGSLPKTIAQLEAEGVKVAQQILGESGTNTEVTPHMKIEYEGLRLDCLGNFDNVDGAQARIFFDDAAFIYKSVLAQENKAVAAILINAFEKLELFGRLLRGEPPSEQLEEEFKEPVGAQNFPLPNS